MGGLAHRRVIINLQTDPWRIVTTCFDRRRTLLSEREPTKASLRAKKYMSGTVRIFVFEALGDFSTASVGACDEPSDAVGKSVVILRNGLGESLGVKDRELV
ncbi:hypothetical protein, partial [Thiomonas sp. SCN 64-16]